MGFTTSFPATYWGKQLSAPTVASYYNDTGHAVQINSVTFSVGVGQSGTTFTGGNSIPADGSAVSAYVHCNGVNSSKVTVSNQVPGYSGSGGVTANTAYCADTTFTFSGLIVQAGSTVSFTLPFMTSLTSWTGHSGSTFITKKNTGSISTSPYNPARYTLTCKTSTGVASFTGGKTVAGGEQVTTVATASSGYHLTKYEGTKHDGSGTDTWTECSGKSTHTDTWTMNANRTVTAYASGNTYTVYWDTNGGTIDSKAYSGKTLSTTITYNTATMKQGSTNYTRIPSWAVPSRTARTGYTFKGWYTSASGGTQVFNASGTYVKGSYWNSSGNWCYAGNLQLYAQWTINSWTVSYNANGGSGAPSNQTKQYNKTLVLTSSKPTTAKKIKLTFDANGGTVSPGSKTKDCGFSKWNTKADGTGTSYASGANYTANSGVTLYAIWSSVSFELPTPTRTNCKFVGWYTAKSGGSKVTTSTIFSKDTTIYARWDYIIKYNLNGGYIGDSPSSPDTIPDSIKHHDESLKLTTVKPMKSGLEFKGWAESSSATSATYSPGGSYTKNEPKTLYAIYGVKTFTVTFDRRDGTYSGSVSLKQTVEYGKSATKPTPDPTKSEHTFKGWVGNFTNVTKDITIYALWNGCPVWIKESDGKWHSYVSHLDKKGE